MAGELERQRNALEDAFFSQSDSELLSELELAIADGEQKQRLAESFCVSDERVISRLLALNLGDRTVAALSLVPLIQVAWADGKIQTGERRALLVAAERAGLKEWSMAYKLFRGWLDAPPHADLVQTWKEYMRALVVNMKPDEREFFKQEFLGRAEHIAAASGGIVKIGSVSTPEQTALDDLSSAFD